MNASAPPVAPDPATTGVDVSPDPGVPVPEPTATATATDEPTTPSPEPTESVTPTPSSSAEPVPTPTDGTSTAPPSPEPTVTETVVVPVLWTHEPAVSSSTIPLGAIVTALLVLAAAAAALALAVRRTRGADATEALAGGPAVAPAASDVVDATSPVALPRDDVSETVRFLLVLGEAMIDSSAPVVQVNRTLERVATINGAPDAEVVALPTAVLVSVPHGASTQTAASSAGWRQLRLHQVQDVLDVADEAEAGDVGPVEGIARIRTAVAAPPLYPGLIRVAGYVGVSAGLAMILGGSLVDVLVASALGVAIASVQVATVRMPAAYQSLIVLTCAFVVSVAVFLLSRTGIDIGLLAPLVAPLVTFLPGALLTTAAIDLATRQMIAGSARLAAGIMQLVLLAIGITGAAALVGVPASEVGAAAFQPLGWAAPWLGVLVYGVGVVFHHCARRPALPWILLVLVVAYSGQVVGGLLVGGAFSAFVGALAMTPVAMFAATRPSGPPALVGFLPGFWLLVPGALGLVGVTSILGDSDQALSTVVTAGTTMVAISVGVLAGIALASAVGRRVGLSLGRL
ncbi:MAG: threonine/serine exporter family protein [Cellulomonas sp.]